MLIAAGPGQGEEAVWPGEAVAAVAELGDGHHPVGFGPAGTITTTSWPTVKSPRATVCFSSTISSAVSGARPSLMVSGLSGVSPSHEKPWAGPPPVESTSPSAFTSWAVPATPPTASFTPSTPRTVASRSSENGGRSSWEIASVPCTTTSVFA